MEKGDVNPHLKVNYFSRVFFGTASQPPAKKATTEAGKQQASASPATAAPAPAVDGLVLQNAEQGKVVTRFPPEASGFLHIGHAKAALANAILRTKYDGKLIFRFDDTNPDKENHEFEQAIVHDLGLLGVKWDIGPTYSSDHFDLMEAKMDELLKQGMAYCDTTEKEEMRACRFNGIATKCRDNSIEENLRLWGEMKKGSAEGKTACVRAKISIAAENKALRDPTMYRCNLTPHPRHGDKYKVYPTYDWCCPIVDSVEGVTHAIRTNEYHDRNAQYEWIAKALNLRCPILEEFSRLNMEYSLMSKRKLTQLVTAGIVDGWDDPRFPTVRGLLRRGLQVEALKDFVKVQGMSKSVNLMEWSKLWNFNNNAIDASSPRYTLVSDETKVVGTVTNAEPGLVPCVRPRHRKNEALGDKTYFKSNTILLDSEDVALLTDGDEVTLMDWCNAFVKDIQRDAKGVPCAATFALNPEGNVKKTKYKLTWIPSNPKNVSVMLHEFDHLLSKRKPEDGDEILDIVNKVTKYSMKGLGEEALAEVRPGQTLQLERRGFYIVDSVSPIVLFSIPDGRDKVNHLSAKAQWLKLNGPKPTAGDTKAAKKGGKEDGGMTLEEKRAAKAAKKAAGKQPKAAA